MRINSNSHPRTPHLQAMIKNYNTRRQQQNDSNALVDRGLDTEARFGTLKEFQRTVDTLLMSNSLVSYRTRMDLLISQFMLLRSEYCRHAYLCTLIAFYCFREAGF